MNNNRTVPVMFRTDKETKDWINSHPLSQSDLCNYGLHLLKQMEERLMKADVRINSVTVNEFVDESVPEWAR